MMEKWKRCIIGPTTKIIEAMRIIDENTMQIALVTDEYNKLLGTVTDGDIRRGILKGVKLDDFVSKIMNNNPVTVGPDVATENIFDIMRKKKLHQIPVVINGNYLIGLQIVDDIIQMPSRKNSVVIMAGGLGMRLRPLTDNCPKPLLRIRNKHILDIIIDRFVDSGFTKFYLCVNYKAEMIEEHIKNGNRWNADIHFIKEKERLGTAGPLSLIPEKFDEPFFVINADILTTINAVQLLDFHKQNKGVATICVKEYTLEVPYGVLEIEKQYMVNFVEKPSQRFFINAGIYLFEPEVIDMIPKNQLFDMPELFKRFILNKKRTLVFPIREYWQDIGQKQDYLKANNEFERFFK